MPEQIITTILYVCGHFTNTKRELLLWQTSLSGSLSNRSAADIVGFECTLRTLLVEANHYNVMALQKIVTGMVTDDSFLYFKCTLILYGRICFQHAINNPEYLLEQIDVPADGESLLYATDQAFLRKVGEDTDKTLPRDYASKVIDYNFGDDGIGGEDWTEAELPKRFPKLWMAYH